MINGYDQQQIDSWKANLYDYEKQKRTKKPFGKDPQIYEKKIVHASQVKQKQRQFDPILQKYSKQHMQKQAEQKQHRRQNILQASHMKATKPTTNYDIVNLHPYTNQVNPQQQNHQQWSKNKNNHNPIRNLYNIINGQSLPSGYSKNRKIKLENINTSRKIYADKLANPEFDIVKAQYFENNDEKQLRERKRQQQRIHQKLNKSHQYDNIIQRYYNPEQQWQYQQQLQKSQLTHGKDYQQRLPPSYRNRQSYQPNYSQQELLTPALKKIIQKQQNTLKRNALRYAIQQQYKKRNDQDYEKRENIIKNKVHEGKILQSMVKEYDIINNRLVQQMNRSMMYEKKLKQHPYSYGFVKEQSSRVGSNHGRSASMQHQQYESYRNNGNQGNSRDNNSNNQNNWDAQSQAYSQRSRSSAARSQSRRYSIKSGGFC